MAKVTRGIRNNNPFNLRANKSNNWLGQTGVDKDGFCIFSSLEYGYRAGLRVLRSYWQKHGLTTVRSVISRFAPASDDNDVDAYVTYCLSNMHVLFANSTYRRLHPSRFLMHLASCMVAYESRIMHSYYTLIKIALKYHIFDQFCDIEDVRQEYSWLTDTDVCPPTP